MAQSVMMQQASIQQMALQRQMAAASTMAEARAAQQAAFATKMQGQQRYADVQADEGAGRMEAAMAPAPGVALTSLDFTNIVTNPVVTDVAYMEQKKVRAASRGEAGPPSNPPPSLSLTHTRSVQKPAKKSRPKPKSSLGPIVHGLLASGSGSGSQRAKGASAKPKPQKSKPNKPKLLLKVRSLAPEEMQYSRRLVSPLLRTVPSSAQRFLTPAFSRFASPHRTSSPLCTAPRPQ